MMLLFGVCIYSTIAVHSVEGDIILHTETEDFLHNLGVSHFECIRTYKVSAKVHTVQINGK